MPFHRPKRVAKSGHDWISLLPPQFSRDSRYHLPDDSHSKAHHTYREEKRCAKYYRGSTRLIMGRNEHVPADRFVKPLKRLRRNPILIPEQPIDHPRLRHNVHLLQDHHAVHHLLQYSTSALSINCPPSSPLRAPCPVSRTPDAAGGPTPQLARASCSPTCSARCTTCAAPR